MTTSSPSGPGQPSSESKEPSGKAKPSQTKAGQAARPKLIPPLLHLGGCIEIVRAIHDLGGDRCEWDQIAAKLNHAPRGGGFRNKMAASRAFGLLEYRRQDVTLTTLGLAILDPQAEKAARVDAFLRVPLFRELFGSLRLAPLPTTKAIENKILSLGVTKSQAGRARQRFIRSATEAGFFEIASDRLVKPSLTKPAEPTQGETQPADGEAKSDHDGTASTTERLDLPPTLESLLAKMPKSEGDKLPWAQWLRAFVLMLSVEYPDRAEELSQISIKSQPGPSAPAN